MRTQESVARANNESAPFPISLSPQDKSALESLYRNNWSTVEGIVRSRCRSTTLAQDITARAFEEAANRFAQGTGDRITTGWMVTVARRRLIDHWRAETRLERLLDQIRVHQDVCLGDELSAETTSALLALSERDRRALHNRYLIGMSVSEVAEDLALTYRATESVLRRARDRLARELQAGACIDVRTTIS